MSRAFVKEHDDVFETPLEREVSRAPNWVTHEGMQAIDSEIDGLYAALGAVGDDRDARARIERDLRYWTARRVSAKLAPPSGDADRIHFGSTVALDRDDGRRDVFRIVGEDEADPNRGTISYTSPLARALTGKAAGDRVVVGRSEIEIVAILPPTSRAED